VTTSASILVVDDDDAVQLLVRRVLEKAGHSVQTVGNGLEALKVIDAAPPDLVISDINMPELDGIALGRRAALQRRDAESAGDLSECE